MKKRHIAAAVFSLFLTTWAQAQDYAPTINRAANAFYQNGGKERKEYITSEKEYGILFNSVHATPALKSETLKEMKRIVTLKHPSSLSDRFFALKRQIEGFFFFSDAKWAEQIPAEPKEREKVKVKIKSVADLLYGGDYEKKHKWAIAEVLAYQQLKKITWDTSNARKKYPNSYQSQLRETLGIRPE